MASNPLLILAILCGSVVLAEWLVRRTPLRHLGTALVVIIVVAVWANLGLIPSASQGSAVYDGVFRYLAPLSIFYLLLDVNLASIRRAGAPMLLLFLLGSAGTALGVVAGMYLIDGPGQFGEFYPAISGMFTGTYTGGSVNYNAIAIHYDMMREGVLYAGMTAVDNIITAVWMVITLAVPLVLRRWGTGEVRRAVAVDDDVERESESVSVLSLGILLGVGFLSLAAADAITLWLADLGYDVPSILVLTSLALVLAQLPYFHRLEGGQVLGLFFVYLFLAVIGAFCDLAALGQIGDLAWALLALVTVIVLIHGTLVFGVTTLFKLDPDVAAVASQANIGGSSSALALAKSLDRMDLYLPGILVGALGNGLGTYLGFLVAGLA
ncbi:DUF819 domain-containing protein [Lewinella sp. IMCC34183]|uniref:DUF819 family protein n=1 Tax=Lewinella sp. IMCC34183 TaxID=2248762 RepID=UPI000E23E61D|nr:DUF819 family protein [Lewinella sp. IMCC34183]